MHLPPELLDHRQHLFHVVRRREGHVIVRRLRRTEPVIHRLRRTTTKLLRVCVGIAVPRRPAVIRRVVEALVIWRVHRGPRVRRMGRGPIGGIGRGSRVHRHVPRVGAPHIVPAAASIAVAAAIPVGVALVRELSTSSAVQVGLGHRRGLTLPVAIAIAPAIATAISVIVIVFGIIALVEAPSIVLVEASSCTAASVWTAAVSLEFAAVIVLVVIWRVGRGVIVPWRRVGGVAVAAVILIVDACKGVGYFAGV